MDYLYLVRDRDLFVGWLAELPYKEIFISRTQRVSVKARRREVKKHKVLTLLPREPINRLTNSYKVNTP